MHFWTLTAHEGRGRITVEAPLGKDPLFIATGTVVPMREPSAAIPSQSDDHLILLTLPGRALGSFVLYDDDRESYAYERGEFSLQRFDVSACDEAGAFRLKIGAIEGRHNGNVRERSYRLEVPLSLARPQAISLDGVVLTADKWHRTNDRTIVELEVLDGPVTVDFR